MTKVKAVDEENSPEVMLLKVRDIMVKRVEVKDLIATDQTWNFPYTSSGG